MMLKLVLLLSILAYHATSTLINLNPTAINRVTPHCFTPAIDPNLAEANLQDCRDALIILAHAPGFTTPLSYSKNPRRGMHQLPLGWSSGNCLILVSCENDRDAYTFRFADVLAPAKKLVDTCVGTEVSRTWGLLRWGGMDRLGDSPSFYVSVFRPNDPEALNGGFVPVELLNQTLVKPAIEVSRRKV